MIQDFKFTMKPRVQKVKDDVNQLQNDLNKRIKI